MPNVRSDAVDSVLRAGHVDHVPLGYGPGMDEDAVHVLPGMGFLDRGWDLGAQGVFRMVPYHDRLGLFGRSASIPRG